ncbi:Ionotropic receptor 146, partial [Hyalella azteca]
EADMSASATLPTYERSTVIDFSQFLYYDSFSIAYKEPSIEPNVRGFVLPFAYTVWLVLAITTIVFSIAVYLEPKISGKFMRERTGQIPVDSRLSTSVFSTFGFLVGQGGEYMRKTTHVTSQLVAVWLLATSIIGYSYKGNLIAMLVLPSIKIPFDNLEQLLSQKELPYRLAAGSFFSQGMENSPPGSLMKRIYEHLDGYDNDVPKIIENIFTSKYAFISNRIPYLGIMAQHFSKTGKCGMQVTTETALVHPISYVYRKKFPLRKEIDNLIVRFRESGILNKLLKDAYGPNVTVCVKPGARAKSEAGLRALAIADFYGVFALLAG